MKDLLISHIKDIDGVSPVILLKLCSLDFTYQLLDTHEVDTYIKNLLGQDLSIYQNIYVTDLSISKEVLDFIVASPYKEKFKVFDHHISNVISKEYDFVTFDTKECGTTLFYFFLREKYPILNSENIKTYITHVRNLDIWLWEKDGDLLAKELGDLFELYGIENYIEKIYERLIEEKPFSLTPFEVELLELEQDKIKRYIDKKEERMLVFSYLNYHFGMVYGESYRSEMGNILSNRHPELDFIVIVNPSGGVSLRTSREDVDLSKIADSLGGGGHKKAAGIAFKDELKIQIISEIFKGAMIDESK